MSWQLANFRFFGRRVQTAPTVVQPLRHLRCCDGDAVTFECHFSGQPEGVRWQRGGKVISNFPAVFLEESEIWFSKFYWNSCWGCAKTFRRRSRATRAWHGSPSGASTPKTKASTPAWPTTNWAATPHRPASSSMVIVSLIFLFQFEINFFFPLFQWLTIRRTTWWFSWTRDRPAPCRHAPRPERHRRAPSVPSRPSIPVCRNFLIFKFYRFFK